MCLVNPGDAERNAWNRHVCCQSSLDWRKHTHLQQAAAAQGECFPIGQMFDHLRCHDGVEKPRLMPSVFAVLALLRRELLQSAGPVADPPPKVRVVGRVEPSRADAVFHRVDAQHDGPQASQRLRKDKEKKS